MSPAFSESVIEQAALAWLESLGYLILSGPEIAPEEPAAERDNYGQVVLEYRLRQALARLNPQVPTDALEEAFRKLTRPDSPSLVANNHVIHKYLVEGVPVEYQRADGSIGGDLVRVFDYDDPENNEFLAVNQYTVVEDQHKRRPDVVLFINGLPIAVIELKNAATENATIWSAFNQLQTYKRQIPSLFAFNEAMVISDGVQARIGTLTADREWFMPWRTIEGETLADTKLPQLQVVLEGVFQKRRLLDLIRHFIVFEDVGGGVLVKKMAGYHQYHAVNVAVQETVRACLPPPERHLQVREGEGSYFAKGHPDAKPGDRRVGVVWHTQGSGKSLTMAFYAGRVVLHPAMENPTLVVITDRNDLDDQLYGTFARCHELLRQPPVQAQSRANLRELLTTASGGVVFTTVHNFFPADGGDYPLLSSRRNIVVIADEAHRSQYNFIDGFARHMREALPNAAFIGFTGTPVELTDKNTRAVFGDYISIYDIERAVKDGATVPIYYESRLAKLELAEAAKPLLDAEFEEATEGEEVEHKERLKTKWAQLEALVGTEKRLKLIAEDLVKHFETRLEALAGKAMIVCMSRRICVDLYKAIAAIRPDWHHADDNAGNLKIVMTGSASDPAEWQEHIRNKPRREELAKRFKDPKDPFNVVIVRDMWLTGFDAPCLHTMYVDKPMRGHGLMQAIARVNRVFKDKPGGLVVDYLGLADQLKYALANYTQSGGKGQTTIDQAEAVAVMLERYEVCCGIFHGFDWTQWKTGGPQERLSILPAAQEHVLAQEDGKNRFVKAVSDLSKAFALAVPHEKALEIRDDVAFFQAVRSVLTKSTGDGRRSPEEIELAIRQIVSKAVSSDEVIDIFAAAGLKKPDISILSDEFLAEVRGMPQRNLAVEMLRKLIEGEIRARGRKNIVQARSFAELLGAAIRKYQNRAIETAQVIEELIRLARDMREATRRGEELGLTEDEVAFYDALEVNDSAVSVLGDETLRLIAQELVKSVRNSITIDWTVRENVRAQMRVIIKRILRKYGYPPDKQARATELVLEQAEVLCQDWSTGSG
ncbi:MAG TPA: type I restriction endonuclease subunit R [Verrucomicrobiota bacterium]|nr:type I restriction endonuclease subunit R [Verrucomicrobiota bacterium]HOQ56638.1 type I restriction endonuclease subunit R [Verrucomicrobiota bacterium]HPC52495.1 type I restriction endonuclease subunit R [Verrucomicrobiota bacterium]HRR63996.1 type I restriction endonuclease subunit R [Candidatus Paceibacterota bacterium]HRV39925.1 type I restriction endonuclease subunit R [Candidatus Paceibacterota bacterium]